MKQEFRRRKEDFEIQTFRCGGKGGQKQNKTETGVRIIDRETGLVAECREHRTQIANRKAAFAKLVDLLLAHYGHGEQDGERLSQEERVRTYNQPDNRVKDHGTGLEYSWSETVGDNDIEQLLEDRLRHLVREEES